MAVLRHGLVFGLLAGVTACGQVGEVGGRKHTTGTGGASGGGAPEGTGGSGSGQGGQMAGGSSVAAGGATNATTATSAASTTGAGGASTSGTAGGAGGVGGSPGGAAGSGGGGNGGTPNCGYDRGTFCHPGVEMNRSQLDFVKAKVAAGTQPWKGAFDKTARSRYASLTWTAKPRATVECGSSSNPDNGCSDEREDAVAAYTHALLWALAGDKAHAEKAIAIMKAWAGTIKEHTNSNAPLQTGWSAVSFAKAGELIRHTYDAWAPVDLDQFANAMRTVYLPVVAMGSPNTNGNWELIMTEAAINLAVFLDDRSVFENALALWRGRVPAYAYLESDGPYPVPPPRAGKDTPQELIEYWQGQSTFRSGLAQETCRDFGHTQWGIAAALNAAETAYQQGVDLYGEELLRLTTTLEFHADYVLGTPAPSWLCGGRLSLSTTPTFEIGYNHYHNRKGVPLTRTLAYLVQKVRASGTPVNYFVAWETLTHADVGAVGVP